MHYQSANPFRERDHRISLMPLARLERDGKPYRFELLLCAGMILATVSVITWSAMQ